MEQLKKIRLLAKNNPEFEFIDKDLKNEIEKALMHGNINSLGEEVFRNTRMYDSKHLHQVLDDTVRLIA